MRRLREEQRTKRRTVADVLDVVRQVLGLEDPPQSNINLGPLLLPSGEWTALVDVVFPDLDCIVTLPTSARFRARSATNSEHHLAARRGGRRLRRFRSAGGRNAVTDG